MKNDDELEDFFKDVFQDAELEPSGGVWERISQSQDQPSMEQVFQHIFDDAELTPSEKVWENVAKQLSPPPKMPRLVWWASGVAASVAITLGTFWLNQHLDMSEKSKISEHELVLPKLEDTQKATRVAKEVQNVANVVENKTKNSPKTEKFLSKPLLVETVSNFKETKVLPSVAKVEEIIPKSEKIGLSNINLLPTAPIHFFENKLDKVLLNPQKQSFEAFLAQQNELQTTWWIALELAYQFYSPEFLLSDRALQSPTIFLDNEFLNKSNIGQALQNNIRFTEATEIGIGFGRKLSRHWAVQTGIYRNVVSYEVNTQIVQRLAADAQNSQELLWKDVLKVQNVFVGVPIALRYESDRKGFNWSVLGGMQADFLQSKQTSSQLDFVNYQLGTQNSLSMSAFGALGMFYKINTNWQIGAEMAYRQNLQSLYQGTDLVSKPTRTNLRLRLGYNF